MAVAAAAEKSVGFLEASVNLRKSHEFLTNVVRNEEKKDDDCEGKDGEFGEDLLAQKEHYDDLQKLRMEYDKLSKQMIKDEKKQHKTLIMLTQEVENYKISSLESEERLKILELRNRELLKSLEAPTLPPPPFLPVIYMYFLLSPSPTPRDRPIPLIPPSP